MSNAIPAELKVYICEVCGQWATNTVDVDHTFGPHKVNEPRRYRTVTYLRAAPPEADRAPGGRWLCQVDHSGEHMASCIYEPPGAEEVERHEFMSAACEKGTCGCASRAAHPEADRTPEDPRELGVQESPSNFEDRNLDGRAGETGIWLRAEQPDAFYAAKQTAVKLLWDKRSMLPEHSEEIVDDVLEAAASFLRATHAEAGSEEADRAPETRAGQEEQWDQGSSGVGEADRAPEDER